MCGNVNTLYRSCGCLVVRTQHCRAYYNHKSQQKKAREKSFLSRLFSSSKRNKSCKLDVTPDIHETSDGFCGKCYADLVKTKSRIVQGEKGPRISLEGIISSGLVPSSYMDKDGPIRGPLAGTPAHSSNIPRQPGDSPARRNRLRKPIPGLPSHGHRNPQNPPARYHNKSLPPPPTPGSTARKPAWTSFQGSVPHNHASSQNKLYHSEFTRVRRPTLSERLRGPGWKSDKLYFTDELVAISWGSNRPQQTQREGNANSVGKFNKPYLNDERTDKGNGSNRQHQEGESSFDSQGPEWQSEQPKLWPDGKTGPRRPRGPAVPVRPHPTILDGHGWSNTISHTRGNWTNTGSRTPPSSHEPTQLRSRPNIRPPESAAGPSTNCGPTGGAEVQERQRRRRYIDSYYDVSANAILSSMPSSFGADGSSDQVDPINNLINEVESQWVRQLEHLLGADDESATNRTTP